MLKICRRMVFVSVALVTLTIVCLSSASAMEAKVVGDQLILSGTIVDTDVVRVASALQNPAITTVVLRNSPGGDSPTGYRVGEMIRQHGLRTALSGFCYSSCSRLFLGGRTRYFTDDFPPEQTNVGFHGHYSQDGLLDLVSVKQYGLRDWIIRYSDGKADPALIDRWIYLPSEEGMIHFYNPGRLARAGVSTFLCDGMQSGHDIADCEPIGKTALDLGIVTSLEVLHSADRSQLQVAQLR
jgi:hypothetical protein